MPRAVCTLALLLVLTTCGRDAPAPPAARSEGSAAPAPKRPRVDRAPLRLGGPLTWASADGVTGMRFCPGDHELVAVDAEGRLRRYRAEDGAQLAVTATGTPEPSGLSSAAIDCRADGIALVLDAHRSPLLVDGKGKTTAPPRPIGSEGAAFAGDGSVMALANDGVTRWNGTSVEVAIPSREHVLYRGLGEGGARIELVSRSAKAADDGLWLTRAGARIKLPDPPGEIAQVSVAPDGGAVVAADDTVAYGWIVKGRTASKPMLLSGNFHAGIRAVAATNKWLLAVDTEGVIYKASRSALKWKPMDEPCGDAGTATEIAVTHDDTRIAVACRQVGIRVRDLATDARVGKDGMNSVADTVAWSPSGDRLATRAAGGYIRVWRGGELATTIEPSSGRELWWQSANELGGLTLGVVTSWTIADGTLHERAPRLEGGQTAAHSPHGELVLVRRTDRDTYEVTIMRGDKTTPVTIPDTKHDLISDLAIDDAGAHAVLTRAKSNDEPAVELIEIDVAAATAKLTELASTAVAIGDGGAIAVANEHGSVIWRGGGPPKTLGEVPGGGPALAISHGVVAAGGDDGVIALWAADGTALGKLAGHTAPIRALAFAPDGLHLASTASDGTLVWDLTP